MKIENKYRIALAFIHLLLFNVCTIYLSATPELSLFTGNKCTKCHLNYQGGGPRSDFGWKFSHDFSIFKSNEPVVENLYSWWDKEGITAFDSIFTFGGDFRLQTMRSHKSENAERRYIPMQSAIYAAFAPFSGIQISSEINFGPKIFSGQQMSLVYAIVKPYKESPVLKFGFIQPSFGLRKCDMTALDRRVAGYDGNESLIPPNFGEFGIELIYDALEWATFYSGIYKSGSLEQISVLSEPVTKSDNTTSYMLKFMLLPEWIDESLPGSYSGASFFRNTDFWMTNIFAGIALMQDLMVYGEFIYTDKEFLRNTFNILAGLSYCPMNGIFIGARYENGLTGYTREKNLNVDFKATQIILYSNIFILPYIELIPEYRYLKTDAYESTRWSAQLHVYY